VVRPSHSSLPGRAKVRKRSAVRDGSRAERRAQVQTRLGASPPGDPETDATARTFPGRREARRTTSRDPAWVRQAGGFVLLAVERRGPGRAVRACPDVRRCENGARCATVSRAERRAQVQTRLGASPAGDPETDATGERFPGGERLEGTTSRDPAWVRQGRGLVLLRGRADGPAPAEPFEPARTCEGAKRSAVRDGFPGLSRRAQCRRD